MRGLSGIRVAVLVLCALRAHEAAGQGVTGFDPPSGVIQVPATGPGAPAITIHNADAVDALFVDLPVLSSFEWADVSTGVGYCVADVTLPSSGSVRVTVDVGSTCILSVAVLATPPAGQSVEENVTLWASGSATLSGSYTLRATASGGGGGSANDHFAAAEDLTGLGIPPYVAIPHPLLQGVFQPRDTVSVTGTTVGSTREPFEYGTVVNPDGSETPPPNGTVWFRYTSPANGFAGRLGYRVTASPRFFATPLVQRSGASWPMPDVRGTDFAPGNTWPPSSLPFVRMEPGHSVWFQVFADVENASGTPVWTDGPFTLELYQAPNEQDSILNAYSITGADNLDGTGRPWTDGFDWFGDGDTYHLTADQPNGPRTMWFTATFDQPGLWTFRVFSEQASRGASTRPLGVRLYRAPSGQRVSDPSELTFVQGTEGSLLAGSGGYPGPVWSSALVDVPVQPGRYYWSVDEGPDGPTFYSLSASYRATAAPPPPVVAFQSTNAGAIGEGGLHQIQITRSGDLSGTTTVGFAIRGGTAATDDIGLVRGTDHVNGGFATLGTGFGTYSLTFNPGVDHVVLAVASAQDSAVEPDETFVLELLSATGATLGAPAVRLATGTILNDDVPANTPPVATADAFSVQEGRTLTVAAPGLLANDTDADGDPLVAAHFDAVSAQGGTVTMVTDGSFTYTPADGFSGTDSLTYAIFDGVAYSAPATVTITVVEGTPIAVADAFTVRAGQTLTVAAPGLLANDSDPNGDAIIAANFDAVSAQGGTVTMVTDGSFTYTPPASFVGTDTFTYVISDGRLFSAAATVTVTVTNTPPVATADAFSVQEGRTLTVAAPGLLANDTDADGDPLVAAQFDAVSAQGGTVTMVTDGSFTYTPPRGLSGTDRFTYVVFDGIAYSAAATVTITVTPSNTAPVAGAGFVTTFERIPVNFRLSATDAENNITGFTLRSVTGGVIAGFNPTTGAGTFVPLPYFNGSAAIGFRVTDAGGLSADGIFTVAVLPVNDPPVGVDDTATTTVGTPVVIDVLANDVDAEDDILTADAFANLVGGTVSLPGDGTVVFTPTPGFVGIGGFTYFPYDGQAHGNATTVTVEVRPVTAAPFISVRVVGTGVRAATVDLEITNIGGSTASNVVLDRIRLRRLDGKGAVLSVTPTPIAIGSLASGDRRLVTLSLTVDPRVRRFSISERGQFVNPAGRRQRFVAAQTVIP